MGTVRRALTIDAPLWGALPVLLSAFSAAQMPAATMATIHDFTIGTTDGNGPIAGVAIGSGGVLYGTTQYGGPSNRGTVYSLTPPGAPGGAWTETLLYSFTGGNDGGNPYAGVAIDSRGVLYGTTNDGGASKKGVAYSLTPPGAPGGSWTESVLHTFTGGSDGGYPNGVVLGSGGALYGTSYLGGASGAGNVFLLTPPGAPGGSWTESVLHSFTGGSDGVSPESGVTIGSGGVLYGTTIVGGTLNKGTVFSLTPPAAPGGAWTEAVLHTFSGGSDGGYPYAGVAIFYNGVLCGTAVNGGSSNKGVVYSLSPPASPPGPWTLFVLHNFRGGSDGSNPYDAVAIGTGGVLYGTTFLGGTSNKGTVFSLKPPLSPPGYWTETVLHSFSGVSDGDYTYAAVAIGAGGWLYGTTKHGGSSNGGTVFALKP